LSKKYLLGPKCRVFRGNSYGECLKRAQKCAFGYVCRPVPSCFWYLCRVWVGSMWCSPGRGLIQSYHYRRHSLRTYHPTVTSAAPLTGAGLALLFTSPISQNIQVQFLDSATFFTF
jgi:hypothetical protein